MTRIKDLQINTMVEMPLVVISAIARETKTKKPYLQLDLYDGYDNISGNYWDWTSGKIPMVNSILNVKAQVTEYMGNKQLNVKSLSINNEKHLSEFTPSSDINISDVYKDAYSLATDIKDDFIRGLTISLLEELNQLWLKVPGAKSVHHAFVGGTLVHSVSVAKIASAICSVIGSANKDLCIAGGLLHDLGKLWTYSMNGLSIDMTDEGLLFDHTYLGARFLNNFAERHIKTENDELKLEILEHIVLSHHGVLEYGAPVQPACIEAHIVHKADGVDAAAQQVLEASKKLDDVKWTERIYTLGNRPQLTTQYVDNILTKDIDSDLPF